MTRLPRQPGYCGKCPECGKGRYLSRKTAKGAQRAMGGGQNAYRCGDYWHHGHLPPPVVQGRIGRDQIINRRTA